MKKALIGMAAGAMALGASVVPVSAGYTNTDNLWDGISGIDGGAGYCDDSSDDIFEALILTGGWAQRLDTDGNGDPRYTVFQPYDAVLSALLDALGLEVSDLNSQPATVQAILADHIANGSFDYDELEDTDLTRITMRSGYVATVMGTSDPVSRSVGSDVYIAGAFIADYAQFGNGWLYCIAGIIDSTPQVPHEGLNSQDTPQDGTPGGTNTLLPDTL
jgi:hypothetical protein